MIDIPEASTGVLLSGQSSRGWRANRRPSILKAKPSPTRTWPPRNKAGHVCGSRRGAEDGCSSRSTTRRSSLPRGSALSRSVPWRRTCTPISSQDYEYFSLHEAKWRSWTLDGGQDRIRPRQVQNLKHLMWSSGCARQALSFEDWWQSL